MHIEIKSNHYAEQLGKVKDTNDLLALTKEMLLHLYKTETLLLNKAFEEIQIVNGNAANYGVFLGIEGRWLRHEADKFSKAAN